MTPAALLLCTTLITNTGHGSVVTRECHAQEAEAASPALEVAAPKPIAPFPSANLKGAASPLTIADGDAAEPAEHTTVRPTKAKRTRLAALWPRHQLNKRAQQVKVIPTAFTATLPAKRLSFWERLNQLPKVPFKSLMAQ